MAAYMKEKVTITLPRWQLCCYDLAMITVIISGVVQMIGWWAQP